MKRSLQVGLGLTLAVALFGPRPAFGQAEESGEALLKKCLAATRAAKTLQADYTFDMQSGEDQVFQKGSLRLKKPNLALMTFYGSDRIVVHSDGKRVLRYLPTEKRYMEEPADAGGANISRATRCIEALVFFKPETLNRFRAMGTGIKVVGTTKIGEAVCKTLQITGTKDEAVFKIHVGPDGLLRGTSSRVKVGEGRMSTMESRLLNTRVDTALPAAALEWKLPADALPAEEAPAEGAIDLEMPPLLEAGQTAPEFSLTDQEGRKIVLSELVKANKVTLLLFWGYESEPCRELLPKLEAFYNSQKDQGLEVVAINVGDESETIARYWKEKKFPFRAAVLGDRVGVAYNVSLVPTTYLIGKDGKVLAAFVGFDEAKVNQQLEAADRK